LISFAVLSFGFNVALCRSVLFPDKTSDNSFFLPPLGGADCSALAGYFREAGNRWRYLSCRRGRLPIRQRVLQLFNLISHLVVFFSFN